MKSSRFLLVLFATIATALSGCNPASDLAGQGDSIVAPDAHPQQFGVTTLGTEASCPCFNLGSLSDTGHMMGEDGRQASDYYLFFDVFDYYDLDPRRTEARALVSTPAGLYEEQASVYITRGDGGEPFLVCHRQDVTTDPSNGEPTYRSETLATTIDEAEACRQAIYASVGEQEPCQGPACGLPYTEQQLDPAYPLYHDDSFRTSDTLLDQLRSRIEGVERILQQPS